MASRDEIVSQVIATLGLTDPELDTSIGSVTRKIIDAVAQPVADAYIDQHLLAYQYDIDSKVEADLDSFCALFGIMRLAPKRATGVVTFYRDVSAADRVVTIPYATQVSSATEPIQLAQTVTVAVMRAGVLTIQVPVQAVEAGPAGNLGAGLLTAIATPVDPSVRSSNVGPLTGGTPREGDSELRERWRRTVFRSLAGAEPMYLGIALDDPDCYTANVVGASKTHNERVQVVQGTATSEIDDLHYIYPGTVSVGVNIGAGQLLVEGRDYTFDTVTRPPTLHMLHATYPTGDIDPTTGNPITDEVEGAVFDLRFEYAPDMTRNHPQQGITNRVDVWCAGTRAQAAQQTLLFSELIQFNRNPGSPYYLGNYQRNNGRAPVNGNLFIPLAFGPILTVPTTLTINGKTFKSGENPTVTNADYWIVHETTADGLTSRSRFGLEWRRTNLPDGSDNYFTIGGFTESDDSVGYTYNVVPRDIQANIDRWRLTGIDAKAHQAQEQKLRFSLAVMYADRTNQTETNTQIEQALASYLTSLGFNATVQASDALRAIASVPGVDNVRFLDGSDYATYNEADRDRFNVGIQRIVNGKIIESYVDPLTGRVRDKTFGDSEIPVFDSIASETALGEPSLRAQNTFYGRFNHVVSGGGGGGGPTPPSNLHITNPVYGPNPTGSGPPGWMVTYNWDNGASGGDFVHGNTFFTDGTTGTAAGSSSYDSDGNPARVTTGWRGFVPDFMPTSTTQTLNFFLNAETGVVSPTINLSRT